MKNKIKKIIAEALTLRLRNKIADEKYKSRSKRKPNDFTRNRKMPFDKVILFMLTSLKCSTNSSLRRFFKILGESEPIKQQSFSEARAKIKPEAISELFTLTIPDMVDGCDSKWHGYRVCAVDGSKIALPKDQCLHNYFGALGENKSSPTAQSSILYDVLNDIILDAHIMPLACDERTLASWHINSLMNIEPHGKKLLLFDRGYPSFDLIDKLEQEGYHYVMRVKRKFNLDIDAQTDSDGYVTLIQGDESIHVRVIKFELDNGETETLITNISDKRLGVNAFKKLYFMRWPIETKYSIIKNKLALESFSSRTVDGVIQDFYATMFLANMACAFAHDAQIEVDNSRANKNNKYEYRVNINEAIGILKDEFILAVSFDIHSKDSGDCVQHIVETLANYVRPVRSSRSNPRKPPRSSRFHHNQKLNC